jgi:hypothetical protein
MLWHRIAIHERLLPSLAFQRIIGQSHSPTISQEGVVAVHLLPFLLLAKVAGKLAIKKAAVHHGAHHSLARVAAKEGAKRGAERVLDERSKRKHAKDKTSR